MKFLLLLVIVAVVLWLARTRSRPLPPSAAPAEPTPQRPQERIVACAQCGLHLPAGDALPGRGGSFCSEAHRALYEQSHAPR